MASVGDLLSGKLSGTVRAPTLDLERELRVADF
jgi:hypothetical protein